MSQTSLFTPPPRHPGAQDRPAPAAPPKKHRDALVAYGAIRSGSLPGRLLALYVKAARVGIQTKEGRTLRALTDHESAALLGVERTTINASRARLVDEGLVEGLTQRKCCAKPSQFRVFEWSCTRKALAGDGR